MAQSDTHVTERELRDAFRHSGLSLRGWTYERAIQSALVRASLCANVRATHTKHQRQHGTPAPMQQALI